MKLKHGGKEMYAAVHALMGTVHDFAEETGFCEDCLSGGLALSLFKSYLEAMHMSEKDISHRLKIVMALMDPENVIMGGPVSEEQAKRLDAAMERDDEHKFH